MKIRTADTIAAVATPAGEGAVALIRLSGPTAIAIADAVFRGRRALATATTYTIHHGVITGTKGEQVDEVLASLFRAPHSYTGEDVVEISCHGGAFVTNAVLERVLQAGARHADPGEFTRRAFLNGKMDLSRAEAVASLIASTNSRAHQASLEQLNGRLADTVEEIRGEMTRLCALLEIDLDFSEEGIDIIRRDEIERKLLELNERLLRMADTFKTGKLYRDGVSVVIAGKPNAGKSSLFNALLKESRAIVTPIPGTTRDFLEESVTLNGILFRLIDTAGLRESEDIIESEGIVRTRKSVNRADIVVIVDDASKGGERVEELLEVVSVAPHQAFIIARNKIDIAPGVKPGDRILQVHNREVTEVMLSAKTGEGVHALVEVLIRVVSKGSIVTHETVQIISHRHWENLTKAAQSLSVALQSLKGGASNEFVVLDVREAMNALGEITGEVTSEDVLNSIFASFCIGK